MVETYTAEDDEGDPVAWSLVDANDDANDADAFTIDPDTGALRFNEPPNYEAPTDTDLGGPNTYHVTVVATLLQGGVDHDAW